VSETVADIRDRAEGATLATAAGDALGWPQEDRSRRIDAPRPVEPRLDFVEWRRRDGGRYAAHDEVIGAGEYSDDTQLVLAVARALRAGDQWWERLTSVELPFWLFYERGGGAATKRAARSWANGKAPWDDERRADYFGAGGNGVAMRVLPHVLRSRGDDFAQTASAVVKDGITTHGHPVALVGAVVYAHALWLALRRDGVLDYGALIAQMKVAVETWSPLPADLPADWLAAANADTGGDYLARWKQTVAAMVELLEVADAALKQGALSVDRETLDQLGAFEKRVSGAGTVSAASAIFLASRYASRPAQGLVAAAFAHGADTDTLAAMSGGLLGAINGRDWLDGIAKRVQDYDHLLRTARALLHDDVEPQTQARPQELRRLWRRLAATKPQTEVSLPDGRHGVLVDVNDLPTKTRHDITVYVARTDDGQTLFLKRVARVKQSPTQPTRTKQPARSPTEEPRKTPEQDALTHVARRRAVVAVEASDLERSVGFYRDLLGLELTRRTSEFANFGGHILVVLSNGSRPGQSRLDLDTATPFERTPKIFVFVASAELESLHEQLTQARVPVKPVEAAGRRRHFACLDPDGTVVEIRETNGNG
jgi:ADP-ribosylglycohydrolase/catechol 2,3-dioxygenase-like lactoylglutathione lyase family enzyme